MKSFFIDFIKLLGAILGGTLVIVLLAVVIVRVFIDH